MMKPLRRLCHRGFIMSVEKASYGKTSLNLPECDQLCWWHMLTVAGHRSSQRGIPEGTHIREP